MARLPVRLLKSTDISKAYPMELVANEANGDLYLVTASGSNIHIKNIISKTTTITDSGNRALAVIDVGVEKVYILPDVTSTNPGLATPAMLTNISNAAKAVQDLGTSTTAALNTLTNALNGHIAVAATDTVSGHVKLSNTPPSAPGTATVGTATTAARADHTHPAQTIPAIPQPATTNPVAPSSAYIGASAQYARADHRHPLQAAATTATYNVNIGTGWSGSAAPFTMTVSVSGIMSSDNPIVDVVLSTTYSTAMTQMEQYAKIYKIITNANSITLYAKEKTTTTVPIQLKCIR